ncbi:MAG: hypothetical protein MJ095_03315 [Oscillospiraceae bacterium]|nr:hypothetical protein [Oscillospiraceae bacterium]
MMNMNEMVKRIVDKISDSCSGDLSAENIQKEITSIGAVEYGMLQAQAASKGMSVVDFIIEKAKK